MAELRKVAIVGSARIPFARGHTAYQDETNLSLLKSGKVKGMKFDTLEAICAYLDCQPGDILEYAPEETPQDRLGDRETDDLKQTG